MRKVQGSAGRDIAKRTYHQQNPTYTGIPAGFDISNQSDYVPHSDPNLLIGGEQS